MKLSINDKRAFREGMKNGLPIGLGYFAVSFSLTHMGHNEGFGSTTPCPKDFAKAYPSPVLPVRG